MIPKIIHYVWVGRNPLPEKLQRYIDTWSKILPEYKIMRWDEDSFDIQSVQFTKEAYEAKKFAFVSDYLRLWALEKHGGIYMDTDVEVLKPLDKFLHHSFFSGFETSGHIPTGLMAAEPHHPWIQEQLEYYKDRSFFLPNGEMELVANVIPMTISAEKHGLINNNTYQELSNGCVFYPTDYFCPFLRYDGLEITDNTHAIHHFEGSWVSDEEKSRRRWQAWWRKWFGDKLGGAIYITFWYCREYGILATLKKIFKRDK